MFGRRSLSLATAFAVGMTIAGALVAPAAAQATCKVSGSYWAPSGYVSVKAYGARGNGNADDTAALRCAILSGSNVWLPTGTYPVTASISIPAAVTIAGESDNVQPTIVRGMVPGLVIGETAGNWTRTGTITVQDLFLDSIGFSLWAPKTTAVLRRNVFSDSRGYISNAANPGRNNLVLGHVSGASIVRDSVFLHGSQSTDAVPMFIYRTSGLTIQQNIVGLYLPQLGWLSQWPGSPAWVNQAANPAMNPNPWPVTLTAKLGALRSMLSLGASQGQWRAGLYTGADSNLTYDSNILYADPATPSLRDHAAYLKGVSGRYTRNWVQGWPNRADGGVKARNTVGPLVIGANYLNDTPILLYTQNDTVYPLSFANVTACGNTLRVVTTGDPTHSGIVYYEYLHPNPIANIQYYGNRFVDPTHTGRMWLGGLSGVRMTQAEADAFTIYTSNTYADNGQTVPISVPGITKTATPGAPAVNACSGLTVPSYNLPAYGS